MKEEKLSIKPLADRIIIKPNTVEDKTEGGIIIPDGQKEIPSKGVVVAVGVGFPGVEMTVKLGDTVIYAKMGGAEIELEGKTYLMMREPELYAIL